MNAHNHNFIEHVEHILERCGGLYTFSDILDCIRSGKMQSHSVGESMCVTEVIDTPRKRVVNVILVVGHLREMPALDLRVTEWAKNEVQANIIIGHGRNGWQDFGKERGWRNVSAVYMKDLV